MGVGGGSGWWEWVVGVGWEVMSYWEGGVDERVRLTGTAHAAAACRSDWRCSLEYPCVTGFQPYWSSSSSASTSPARVAACNGVQSQSEPTVISDKDLRFRAFRV